MKQTKKDRRSMGGLEKFVDVSIPYSVITLLVLLFFELFIELDQRQWMYIEMLNLAVILVFIVDLYFLYKKSPDWKYFLRHYWLDLLAVIPVTLIVRGLSASALTADMPYATLLSLVKAVRIERFLGAGKLNKMAEILDVFKKIRITKGIRLMSAYDKGRRGTAKALRRQNKNSKEVKR